MFFRGIFGIFAVFKNFSLFIPRYVSKPLKKLRSVERYISYLDSSAIKQHTSYLPVYKPRVEQAALSNMSSKGDLYIPGLANR